MRYAATAALLLGLAMQLAAQTRTAVSVEESRFQVASVKPVIGDSASPDSRGSDRFFRSSIELRSLVMYAYDLPEYRVLGGPAWADSDSWQVSARAAKTVSRSETQAMVRTLLAERFRLKVHVETRQLPVYDLVVARRDGRLGPKATRAKIDCVPFLTGARPMAESPIEPDTGFPRCTAGARVGPDGIQPRLNGVPMSFLADYVGRTVGRMVVDKTGITGPFDFALSHRNDGLLPFLNNNTFETKAADTSSLFTALQEQLGLRLESRKGPVDVLVIDTVERPTPN